jgi:hypothetical protein
MSRISDLAGFTTALSTTEDLSVGIITASSFSGNLTGDVTGDVTGNADTATNAAGLTGTPNISVGSVNASSGTISGNLSIGGTLTYQDVTNVDAVGMVTARKGIQVLADGINAVGVVTATSFAGNLTGDVNAATFDTGVGGVVVTGVTTSTSFDGNLNASQLASGTIPDARIPDPLPAVSGENLTNLPASGDSNDITASLFI